MDSFRLPLKNCGRCRYWGATHVKPSGTFERLSGPVFSNGTAEHFCGLRQRGHDRRLNPGWTFASDRCGKWDADVAGHG